MKGLKHPCPRYDTKPENVPIKLIGAINTAEELRELKELRLLPGIDKLSSYEYECYKIAEAASRQVESEYYKEMSSDKNKEGNAPEKFGGPLDAPDPNSAFSSW